MLKRDYLIKQFEEFGKVIAVMFGLKKNGMYSELEELIKTTVLKYTSLEIEYVESIDKSNLLETLTTEKKLNDEQVKMIGDLLYEKADYYNQQKQPEKAKACYEKTLIIYTFLQNNSTLPYSLDVHYRVNVLKEMLNGSV